MPTPTLSLRSPGDTREQTHRARPRRRRPQGVRAHRRAARAGGARHRPGRLRRHEHRRADRRGVPRRHDDRRARRARRGAAQARPVPASTTSGCCSSGCAPRRSISRSRSASSCSSAIPDVTFAELPKRLLVNTVDLDRGARVVWGLPGLEDVSVRDADLRLVRAARLLPAGPRRRADLHRRRRGRQPARLRRVELRRPHHRGRRRQLGSVAQRRRDRPASPAPTCAPRR